MRTFVILCLVAVACADKLGYNYQPVGHADNGLSFAPGGGSSGGGIGGGPSGGGGSFGGGPSDGGFGGSPAGSSFGGGPSDGGFGGSPSGSSFGGGPSGGGLGGGPAGGFNDGGGVSDGPGVGAAEPELEKEFYTFTANDEDFGTPEGSEQVANSLKKSLRVIFIKGPESSGLEKAAVNLAKHAGDQQTAIYVLNKQADIGDLANKLNAVHDQHAHKPDVHFVKYRTPEDAANAQKAIQSQYDQLGGSSQSHDGGVAPVHNFASPAAPANGGHHGSIAGPSSSYLPASVLRIIRR